MAQGSSGSYYDAYMRSSALLKHCGEKDTKKLLTDRSAYISFLEVQLERVSAACLTTQTFEKRLSELESARVESDQKLGSLSKVLRLNQEFVEQTAQQTQHREESHAAEVHAWMDKFSAEFERQRPRVDTLEEQFRQCQEYLPQLAESNGKELQDVKRQAEREAEELKALVFALEARVEELQASQSSTCNQVEELRDTTTSKLQKELALVRTSVSEKSFKLEATMTQLSKNVEDLVHQQDAGWRAEYAEANGRHDEHLNELQNRLKHAHQEFRDGQTEVKGVLQKCLDTQHLLSEAVVALQCEVDDGKRTREVAASRDIEAAMAAVEDLRANQQTLKAALKALQSCTLEVQQAGEDRCGELADRLTTAEEAFERLAQESSTRADDLRKRMLDALEDVGEKLNQEAGAATENSFQAVWTESEAQFAHIAEFTATLDNRLRMLEHTVLSLETKVQRSRAISDVLGHCSRDAYFKAESPVRPQVQPFEETAQRTPIYRDPKEKLSTEICATRAPEKRAHTVDWSAQWSERGAGQQYGQRVERYYQERIRELEERLHRKEQAEEEQRALFPERICPQSSCGSSTSSDAVSEAVHVKSYETRRPHLSTSSKKEKTAKRSAKAGHSAIVPKTTKTKKLHMDRVAGDRSEKPSRRKTK